eukprot:TRINITY_DN2706_c0_g1_i2.p1 TRINITY_DN2706_c0_g1~~TRINITY_DN2706_c0_g1_i2.p1  ORF type:complete len:178 (-),score=25.27 TRINITY_DN2706_c0_g1_i2:242-739(-)
MAPLLFCLLFVFQCALVTGDNTCIDGLLTVSLFPQSCEKTVIQWFTPPSEIICTIPAQNGTIINCSSPVLTSEPSYGSLSIKVCRDTNTTNAPIEYRYNNSQDAGCIPDPCAAFTNCGNCTANSTCTWCETEQICATGSMFGTTGTNGKITCDILSFRWHQCAST